jgi:DNA (cytosine-5)-methyltransferase 3A
MNVLSLFDGISAGQVALQRAGIAVENYYASEIDKYAVQITQKNHPNTIQLGDITKWREWDIDWSSIDMVIGGSPCQGFSFAGKQLNFEDPRSKLFFDYLDICNHVADHNPKMKFLLENVRMKQEYQDVISEFLGISPMFMNSSLVSAQNRPRLYWTNINDVSVPENKDIMLIDIIEGNKVDDKYMLSKEAIDYMSRLRNGKPRWEYHKNPLNGKAACLTANMYKGVPYGVITIANDINLLIVNEATKKGFINVFPGDGVDLTFPSSKTRRGRLMEDKSNCLTATTYDYCFWDGHVIRKLTPIECERLQTFPDNYTEGISNSQRYKSLGNGWTVDMIAHIFSHINNKK